MSTQHQTAAAHNLEGRGNSPADARLNEKQAAAFLGLSPKTLQAWRLKGTGPRFLKLGRAVRYNAGTLRAFLEEQERRSTADTGAGGAQ